MPYAETATQPISAVGEDAKSLRCPIACVGFADITGQSAAEQRSSQAALRSALGSALSSVAADRRIVLDPGDGLCVVFLDDAVQCLRFALALRDAASSDPGKVPPFGIGIDFGEVRLAQGGVPRFSGAGLNFARRLLALAGGGEIVTSAAFHDRLRVQDPPAGDAFLVTEAPACYGLAEPRIHCLQAVPAAATLDSEGEQAQPPPSSAAAAPAASAPIGRRAALATMGTVALVLLTAVGVRAALHSGLLALAAVAHPAGWAEPAPAGHVASLASLAPTPAARGRHDADGAQQVLSEALPAEPAPMRAGSGAAADRAPGPGGTASREGSGGGEAATIAATASPPAAAATAAASVASAQAQSVSPPVPASAVIRFHIVPWGEVHLDGRNLGAAPPLGQIALVPGVHRVEVRNPGFPSHVQTVDLRAGEEVGIRYRFE